jgi:hypothetical protein
MTGDKINLYPRNWPCRPWWEKLSWYIGLPLRIFLALVLLAMFPIFGRASLDLIITIVTQDIE